MTSSKDTINNTPSIELDVYKKLVKEESDRLKQQNDSLQYKLSITSNLLDISKYLNTRIANDNIFNVINDVAISIFQYFLNIFYSYIWS